MDSSRVPALVGALIACLGLVCLAMPLPPIAASTGPTISEVRITNVRDTAFTVSWLTDVDALGSVAYGRTPTDLSRTAFDDRGAAFRGGSHYVTIQRLVDEATYYLDVVSNETTDDNGGAHYVARTGATLGTPSSDTVYGRVFQRDGSTAAAGVIVYVTLADADGSGALGEAATMSGLVDDNGWWSANLGNARINDLSDYFHYSARGDALHLVAQAGGKGTANLMVDTAGDDPTPAMTLSGPHTTPRAYLPILLAGQPSVAGDGEVGLPLPPLPVVLRSQR